MLENSNIQFTRASKLNDSIDCHIDKIDYSLLYESTQGLIDVALIDKKKEEERDSFNNIGICSFGKTSNNEILWEGYTRVDGKDVNLDQVETIKQIVCNKYNNIPMEYIKY